MNRERYSEYNDAGEVLSAEASQTIKNTKIIFQNLLLTYFNSLNTEFVKRDAQIHKFMFKDHYEARPRGIQPISIVREFPKENRNYPFVVVKLSDYNERKMYLGWDNLATYRCVEHEGLTIGEIDQIKTFDCKITLSVAVSNSIDDRDMLIDYIAGGFISFFRSNYVWHHPDGLSQFFVHVGHKAVKTVLDGNKVDDTAGGATFPVYLGDVVLEPFIEQYYRISSPDFISKNDYKAIPYTEIKAPLLP